jgi:hypothetical protein
MMTVVSALILTAFALIKIPFRRIGTILNRIWKRKKAQVKINTPKSAPASREHHHRSLIDINTASSEELLALPCIGVVGVGLILKRIQCGQSFGSLEELNDYLRLKPHETSQLRGRVCFSPRDNGMEVPQGGGKSASSTEV